MIEPDDTARTGDSLPPRVALLSILGFWLFYFAIVSLRAAVLYVSDPWDMLARRTIVTVVSAGVTLLLYLVLRRVPRRSLGWSIAIAALLAIPAAILYSTVNWFAFRAVGEREQAADADKATKMIVVESPRAAGDGFARRRRTINVRVDDPTGRRHESIVTVQEAGVPLPPGGGNGTPVPLPPLPPLPEDVNRRITVQVGGAAEVHEANAIIAIADNAANGYFFIAAWAALYLALCYAAQVRDAERRAAGFRAAAQAAEIRALRYQVNPHFLFNTLNSLSSLVMTGRADAAELMIMNLSTFFRTSLAGDPSDDVRLDEEIRLQRLYLDIETVRFPDRLMVEIDVPPALADACVPGLILQPLVENAVKYGVSRARRPVTIRIDAREEAGAMRLTVRDDGDPLPPDAAGGTGVGLRNVRDRIAARHGVAGTVRWGALPGGGFTVSLLMPVVRRAC